MAKIPLQKWAELNYPMTSKSTINYWAGRGFWGDTNSPLCGKVSRIGGRWYVDDDESDHLVDSIVSDVVELSRKHG